MDGRIVFVTVSVWIFFHSFVLKLGLYYRLTGLLCFRWKLSGFHLTQSFYTQGGALYLVFPVIVIITLCNVYPVALDRTRR